MRALRTLAPAVAVLTALTLAGCGSSGEDDPKIAAPSSSPSETAPASFDIKVEWEEPSTAAGDGAVGEIAASENQGVEEFSKYILESGAVDGIAARFSREFVIPEQLTIHVVSGDEGPNYNPSTKTLTLSYGFATLTGNIIAAATPDLTAEDFGTAWASVNDFILVHEMAHAFVDVLRKPDGEKAILVTGKEEDTADGMATYFFTDAVEKGPQFAFEAAKFFAALQDFQGAPGFEQYADEHSLSIQRAVDIACKVAGSSEDAFNAIASFGVITDARLQRCPSEYEQLSTTWEALLKPVRKADPEGDSSSSASPTS